MNRASLLVGLALALGGQGCRRATRMVVALDTNISRPMRLTVIAFEGALTPREAATRAHAQGARPWLAGDPVSSFPTEIWFRPKEGGAEEGVMTAVFSVSAPGTAMQPAIDFDRVVRFSFVRESRQTARVFLQYACTLPASGCRETSVPCTLARRCEEQGLVCNDDASCGSPQVEQRPLDVDAAVDSASPALDSTLDAREAGGDAMPDAEAGPTLIDRAPRPISPMSGAITTSRRPSFHWSLPAGVSEARVELCADRACSRSLLSLDGTTTARPSADLPPGPVFWRLRARAGSAVGQQLSPVWQAWIPAASAGGDRDVTHGHVADFNGDGLADIVLGAPTSGGNGAGYVWVFPGRSGGPAATPALTLRGATGAGFGHSVSSAGDVNGDGYSDLVVGAWRTSGTAGALSGAAHVFVGGPSGLHGTASATFEGASAGARFGMSVAAPGDINGDGFGDVIVGAPQQNVPGMSAPPGLVQSYFGSEQGLRANSYAQPGQASDWFGTTVAGAGDVNADGFVDLIAAAPYTDTMSLADAGAVYLVHGAPAWIVIGGRVNPDRSIFGLRASEAFGVAGAGGDVNNDGYADVVLAGSYPDARSRVAVYAGTSSGLGAMPMAEFSGGASDMLGFSGAIGDVDNDGVGDVLLGALVATAGGTATAGNARLYASAGGRNWTTPTRVFESPSPRGGAYFGFRVAIVGDVNGDSVSDFVVTEPAATVAGRVNAGRAFVCFGGASPRFGALAIDGANAEDRLGYGLGR